MRPARAGGRSRHPPFVPFTPELPGRPPARMRPQEPFPHVGEVRIRVTTAHHIAVFESAKIVAARWCFRTVGC